MNSCDISHPIREKEDDVISVIHEGRDYTLKMFKELVECYSCLNYEKNQFVINSILCNDCIIGRTWWFKFEIIKDSQHEWRYYEYSRNKRKS